MNIDMEIQSSQQEIDIDFGFDGAYTGSYEPAPNVDGYELDTANKTMLGNIKIKPIPITRASAPSGNGYVITIG